jgi:ribosomal protein L7/L12
MSMNLEEEIRPQVILTFKKGKVIKETKGFKGQSCVEATKIIQEILKPTEEKVTFKDEYMSQDWKEEKGLIA